MEVDVYEKTTVGIEEVWVLRGVKNTNKGKKVIAEMELVNVPSAKSIAQFLINNTEADFCSAEHNYRILGYVTSKGE